jgi:hypothetical protein
LALVRDRALLQATFDLCRVDGPNAQGAVIVTLHSERKMHQDRLQSPVIQQELTKAIQDAAGKPVKVEFRVPDAAGAGAEATAPPTLDPGPAAKRVMEKFRGRIVQVNPEDRVVSAESPSTSPDDETPPATSPEPEDS